MSTHDADGSGSVDELFVDVARAGFRDRIRLAATVVLGRPISRPRLPKIRRRLLRTGHRATLQALAALALVTALVALVCYVAFALLAGQRFILGTGVATSADTARREQVRDLRAPSPDQRPATSRTVAEHAPSQAARPGVVASPVTTTTIDGSVLATILSGGTIAAGLAIQRALLRRLEKRNPHLDDQEDPDQENPDEESPGEESPGEESPGEESPGEESPDEESAPEPDDGAPDAEPDAEAELEADRDPNDRSQDPETGVAQPSRAEEDTDHGDVDADLDARPTTPTRDASAVESPRPSPTESASNLEPGIERATVRDAANGLLERLCEGTVLYDRRMNRQVAVHGPARLQWPGHDLACEAESLDIRGIRCLLATSDGAPPAGTAVRITVTVDGALLSLGATVTSTRDHDRGRLVAFVFDPLNDMERDFLLAFIQGAADAA